ncbi:MAG: hypothetical protein AB7G75_30270 [Candidatus Binatia bacterium]
MAYGTVLQEQRKALHEQTARAMEQIYKDQLEEHSDELAQHYQRISNAEKAITYLQLAGQQAVQRSANEEAVLHFTTAIALLQTLPDTPERDQRELALHVALGGPLMVTKGFAAPEVEKVYLRARELCGQLGNASELFPTLWGLWAFYVTRDEHKTAHDA